MSGFSSDTVTRKQGSKSHSFRNKSGREDEEREKGKRKEDSERTCLNLCYPARKQLFHVKGIFGEFEI